MRGVRLTRRVAAADEEARLSMLDVMRGGAPYFLAGGSGERHRVVKQIDGQTLRIDLGGR